MRYIISAYNINISSGFIFQKWATNRLHYYRLVLMLYATV